MTRTGTKQLEAEIAFSDLPLFEAATDALLEQEYLAATLAELLERLTTRQLSTDDRRDIAADLRKITTALAAFALVVLA